MAERLLRAEEVALSVGISVKTLNNWYLFKRANPDNEYAQMIPECVQEGSRRQRFWKSDDVWKLMQFKKSIPMGRNGIMGGITQKYYHNKKQEV